MYTDFANIDHFIPSAETAAALAQDGISVPTPIQRQAIAAIAAGEHVIVQSPTGTGKTLAYLLPLLQRLRRGETRRALVFAPGVDLAMQIARVANRYGAPDVGVAALVASVNAARQRDRLKKKPPLVVGTPGRLLEGIAARKLKGVGLVVLDEPEPILSGEIGAYLLEVVSRPEPPMQLVIVGATIGGQARALAEAFPFGQLRHLQDTSDVLQTAIAHHFVSLRGAARDVLLARLIQQWRVKRALVFVNDARARRHLYRYFSEHRLRPASLSHDRPTQERAQTVADFQSGRVRLLLTNDAAGRGLDVSDVGWVFHYDLPPSAALYIHRAGRTGRAGKSGRSVALTGEKETPLFKRYCRELGLTATPLPRVS